MAEGVDRFRIGLGNDLAEDRFGLVFTLTGDGEGVDADLDRVAVLRRLGADILDLLPDLLGRIAVGEVPIGNAGGHVAGGAGGAALENLGLRIDRLGFQGIIVVAVEIAPERKIVLAPDTLECADEFLRTAIALVMVEPWLAD